MKFTKFVLCGLLLVSRLDAAAVYVTTTNGGIWQYDNVADMATQTTTTSSGNLVATHAAYATDQGSTMDLSTGFVYRITNIGDVVQYSNLSNYLTNTAAATVASGVYTGNNAVNGVSYDGGTGGFYVVGAGSSTTIPGDIVQYTSLGNFLTNTGTVSAATYNGNLFNFYDPDSYATTAVGTGGATKTTGQAFNARYFQVAGNGRLEGFESIADYIQNANNRGNITAINVFGGSTTAWGTGVVAATAFAVPEPSMAMLGCLGLLGFLRRRR